MGLVVIKADDQRMINMKGNILGMTKTLYNYELSQYSIHIKTYYERLINWDLLPNQLTLSNDFKIF